MVKPFDLCFSLALHSCSQFTIRCKGRRGDGCTSFRRTTWRGRTIPELAEAAQGGARVVAQAVAEELADDA